MKKCSNNHKCTKYITAEGTLYKKETTNGKHWWSVSHGQGWFVISGEPNEKLTPINQTTE